MGDVRSTAPDLEIVKFSGVRPSGVSVGLGPIFVGAGQENPEGQISAPAGSLFARTDTGELCMKSSGAGATGWIALAPASALSAKATVVAAPDAANSAGVAGVIAFDDTHIYVCVATDTWLRADLATWGA